MVIFLRLNPRKDMSQPREWVWKRSAQMEIILKMLIAVSWLFPSYLTNFWQTKKGNLFSTQIIIPSKKVLKKLFLWKSWLPFSMSQSRPKHQLKCFSGIRQFYHTGSILLTQVLKLMWFLTMATAVSLIPCHLSGFKHWKTEEWGKFKKKKNQRERKKMKAEKRRGQVEREGVPWEQLTLA